MASTLHHVTNEPTGSAKMFIVKSPGAGKLPQVSKSRSCSLSLARKHMHTSTRHAWVFASCVPVLAMVTACKPKGTHIHTHTQTRHANVFAPFTRSRGLMYSAHYIQRGCLATVGELPACEKSLLCVWVVMSALRR